MRNGGPGVSWSIPPGAVITPEGVVLHLRTGGLPTRGLAKALDLLIANAAGSAIIGIVALAGGVNGVLTSIVAAFVGVLTFFGYSAILETRWRGRTIGKAALGLRVVTDVGGPIGFRHALVRSILWPIDLLLGVEVVLLSRQDRRLGDVLAGTIVISERSTVDRSVPLWFNAPPGLQGYCDSLDVSRLTSEELALAREFLVRVSRFKPLPRIELAVALAAPIASRLGHPVPPGMPPDVYLLCIVSAHQEVDDPVSANLRRRPPEPLFPWGPPPSHASWGAPAVSDAISPPA